MGNFKVERESERERIFTISKKNKFQKEKVISVMKEGSTRIAKYRKIKGVIKKNKAT